MLRECGVVVGCVMSEEFNDTEGMGREGRGDCTQVLLIVTTFCCYDVSCVVSQLTTTTPCVCELTEKFS